MTTFRLVALTLALGLLVGCDEPPKPPAPIPAPLKTEPEASPPAPAESVEPMLADQPAAAPVAEPVPAPKPAAEPRRETRAAPPDKAPVAASSKPKATEKPSSKAVAKPVTKPKPRVEPLPPVKLDLRLPDELVQQLEPGEPLEKLPEREPLLPPLFVEKPAEPGPYQLNGRLITNDRDDDYWDSVEGAELQIEFRN
jgi:hypothetical protein